MRLLIDGSVAIDTALVGDHLDAISARVAALQKHVTDAASYLPPYDLRSAQEVRILHAMCVLN